MEQIKVTRNTFTRVVFKIGDAETGFYKMDEIQEVENKDPQNLNIAPITVGFYFGETYFLTDETGRKYVPYIDRFDFMTPMIYCGKIVSTDEALKMFNPDTWQYKRIDAWQKNGIERISVTSNGFVEGLNKDDLTLEEYFTTYSDTKGNVKMKKFSQSK